MINLKIFVLLVILSSFCFALNLNTATRADLMSLGLSRSEALSIIKYRKVRKFSSVQELFKVQGLSSKSALKIRDKVKVETKNKVQIPKKK